MWGGIRPRLSVLRFGVRHNAIKKGMDVGTKLRGRDLMKHVLEIIFNRFRHEVNYYQVMGQQGFLPVRHQQGFGHCLRVLSRCQKMVGQ